MYTTFKLCGTATISTKRSFHRAVNLSHVSRCNNHITTTIQNRTDDIEGDTFHTSYLNKDLPREPTANVRQRSPRRTAFSSSHMASS